MIKLDISDNNLVFVCSFVCLFVCLFVSKSCFLSNPDATITDGASPFESFVQDRITCHIFVLFQIVQRVPTEFACNSGNGRERCAPFFAASLP